MYEPSNCGEEPPHRVGLVDLGARLDDGQAAALRDLAEHCLRHLSRRVATLKNHCTSLQRMSVDGKAITKVRPDV